MTLALVSTVPSLQYRVTSPTASHQNGPQLSLLIPTLMSSCLLYMLLGEFPLIMDKWPYAHSRTSPHIAICTPAFLANFIKGPNIKEEELFSNLRQLVLDEVNIQQYLQSMLDRVSIVDLFHINSNYLK